MCVLSGGISRMEMKGREERGEYGGKIRREGGTKKRKEEGRQFQYMLVASARKRAPSHLMMGSWGETRLIFLHILWCFISILVPCGQIIPRPTWKSRSDLLNDKHTYPRSHHSCQVLRSSTRVEKLTTHLVCILKTTLINENKKHLPKNLPQNC